eukprot:scaffold7017_cov134-Cylindrotheca_fusiformis.AAC.34
MTNKYRKRNVAQSCFECFKFVARLAAGGTVENNKYDVWDVLPSVVLFTPKISKPALALRPPFPS